MDVIYVNYSQLYLLLRM